jgi:hypothetical protein
MERFLDYGDYYESRRPDHAPHRPRPSRSVCQVLPLLGRVAGVGSIGRACAMNPSNALQSESGDLQGASQALLVAIGHINGWPRKIESALKVLETYQAYGRYRSTSEHRSAMMVSQVCGASGDCHMLRGEVDLAATWYRLSIGYRKDTGFPQAYARLVVDHHLRDHFRPALEALRERHASWLCRPWLDRACDTVVAFAWLNRCRPSWIRSQIRDRRLLPQLENLVTSEQ